MKKASICLVVLALSGALAWLVYRKFDSATAGYIVAVVGMAAAIVPIFLPSEKKAQIQIKTTGNYSPGVVEGDYRVNEPTEKKDKK